MTTKMKRSLVGGISVLSLSGLICKVVGVAYRIPLANIIGARGIGVYGQVFQFYNLLLTISSAGLPVAISRMVAHHLARANENKAKRVFQAAIVILGTLGLFAALFMALFSGAFSAAVGSPSAKDGFLAIAPSLFLVCVLSAYRGYMQGRRNMWPTAISQLIEQVGKVFVALPLAAVGMQQGGFAQGAAGALWGTSIAEAAALLYMALRFRRLDRQLPHVPLRPLTSSDKHLARDLVVVAIPITIGASIVPLAGAVDSVMLVNIMRGYLGTAEAQTVYGVYAGLVLPLINVPTAFALATAASLVPSVSSALSKNARRRVKRESADGLRMASVIGFPAAIGLSFLAEPILMLLFGRSGKYTPELIRLGGDLLSISGLTVILFIQVQATSAILQGLRKQRIPMYTLIAGVAAKIALNYSLVHNPAIGIRGAPWASLLCYGVSLAPNLYYVAKYARLRINWREVLLLPALATGAMGAVLGGAEALLGARLGRSWLFMGLVILVGIAVYAVVARALGVLKDSDLPSRFRRKA